MKTIDEMLFENMMRFRHKTKGGPRPEEKRGHGPHHPMPMMGFGHGNPHKEGFERFGGRPMEKPPVEGMRPPMPGHHGPKPMLSRERVLEILADSPEGMRQRQLAEKLHISAPSVSELVNKLENDGYVVRKADENDKRATLLVLTEMGSARAREVADERARFAAKFFDKLTAEEKQTLLSLLTKLYSEE